MRSDAWTKMRVEEKDGNAEEVSERQTGAGEGEGPLGGKFGRGMSTLRRAPARDTEVTWEIRI